MTDPQISSRRFLAVSPHTFRSYAEGEILHSIMSPSNFLPVSLRSHERELRWFAPAYATVYDTPITDDLLHAALVSMGDNLAENVVLPPNIKLLSEKSDLLDYYKAFIGDFSIFSAIYQCWAMSEYEGNATMARAFRNWVATCDQLVANPHFSTG